MMNSYPGVLVSHNNFCGLLKTAWDKSLSEDNIKAGFEVCGIFPFNPDRIPMEAYLPNSLYVATRSTDPESTVADASQSTDPEPTVADASQSTDPEPTVAEASQSTDPEPTVAGASQSTDPEPTVAEASQSTDPEPTVADAVVEEPVVNADEINVQLTATTDLTLSPLQMNESLATESDFGEIRDVLNMSDYLSVEADVVDNICTIASPSFSMEVLESVLTSQQLQCFAYCFENGFDISGDNMFLMWKRLKVLSKSYETNNASSSVSDIASTLVPNDVVSSVINDTSSSLPNIASSSSVLDICSSSSVLKVASTSVSDVVSASSVPNVASASMPNDASSPVLNDDTTSLLSIVSSPNVPNINSSMMPNDDVSPVLPNPSSSFAFNNTSHPEDKDSDVLPYPEKITRPKKST